MKLSFREPRQTYVQWLLSVSVAQMERADRATLEEHLSWARKNGKLHKELQKLKGKIVTLNKQQQTYGDTPWPEGSPFLVTDVWKGMLHAVAPVPLGPLKPEQIAPVLLRIEWITVAEYTPYKVRSVGSKKEGCA